MQLEARSLFFDMPQACDLIIEFTAGKTYSDYISDAVCRSAVERQFITLGEALSRLGKTCPEEIASIPNHRTILNCRNILVHGDAKARRSRVGYRTSTSAGTARDTCASAWRILGDERLELSDPLRM